ncbi:MAG: RNA-binding S4 domain-containing protein [Bacteroidetes bacterium]|nr:MAG: RNA-binding S4 domain-containing protein [Bacteroidota bacterium]MBL1143962.1 RNA-binding S4 domain-containing protein [Bacteroidota bacterium]NOG56763.1 RNA-binding S4 domain-containing protein [Bacteroidota bacterium]
MMEFELTSEYIELIKLLKLVGLADTGGMAKQMVEDEEVLYNGNIDTRKRLKVRKGDIIQVNETTITII